MIPRTFARRAGLALLRLLGPIVLTWLPYVAWVPVNRGMILGDLPTGAWVWLLLPPGLVLEWLASRYFDAPPIGLAARRRGAVGLALRWSALGLYFYVLLGRTVVLRDTPDIFCMLVGYWPEVARFPYVASPVLGSLGALGLLALYLGVTVRRRCCRLATTLLLPLAYTLALFHFWYAFPDSRLHFVPLSPEAPVERVFPFAGSDAEASLLTPPFYARDLYVAADETTLVASYGATFLRDLLPQPQPNLARVDLATHGVRLQTGSPIRRFQSTCPDRLYMAPWHRSVVEEIDPRTFESQEIRLPSTLNDEAVEEINFVLHDCATHRVYVANSRNPVLFVWDTRSRALEKTVNLVGVNGIRLGDAIGLVRKNPNNGRIYVVMHGAWNLVELDGDTLEPRRFARVPAFPFEAQVTRDGAWLYMTAFMSGTMWKIDTDSLQVVQTYDTPVHCRRVEPTDDGSAVIVISHLTGEIASYDAATGRELARLRVGPKAQGLSVTRSWAWVHAATGIFRIPLEALAPRVVPSD